MSTISAGTTITTALVQTGDLTGDLVLKTDTSNTAVTINGVGAIGFGSTPDYGTAGQFMRSGGVAGVPSWQTVDANQWISNSTSIYYNSGNVGIGTSSPTQEMELRKDQAGGTQFKVTNKTNSGASTAGVNFENSTSDSATISLWDAGSIGAYSAYGLGIGHLGTGGIAIVAEQASASIRFATGGTTERMRIDSSGMVLPGANNTYDLGSTSLRWRNIYTNDLHLSNGIGDYTVVEGEEDLFLYNNKSGKTFKFALIEVDPSEAPPKAKT